MEPITTMDRNIPTIAGWFGFVFSVSISPEKSLPSGVIFSDSPLNGLIKVEVGCNDMVVGDAMTRGVSAGDEDRAVVNQTPKSFGS